MSRDDSGVGLLLLLLLYAAAQAAPLLPTLTPLPNRPKKRARGGVPLPPRTNDLPTLNEAGKTLYELLHSDAAYSRDLPGRQLTKEAVLAIAKNAGFPDPKVAAAIAYAESGGVPGAIKRSSKEYSVGLWQINTMAHPYSVDDMKDPIKNSRAAFAIFKRKGWTPWSDFKNGRYKQYMTGALAR